MLCSLLIPTRAHPDRLIKMMKSVVASVISPANIEFWLRVDFDDDETRNRLDEILGLGNVKVIIGERKKGYFSLGLFYDELVKKAKGQWLWLLNDDVIFNGRGWDIELAETPRSGVFIQAETYTNGHAAFPLIPAETAWYHLVEIVQDLAMFNSVDTVLHDILVRDKGWIPTQLSKVNITHEQDPAEIIVPWHHECCAPS